MKIVLYHSFSFLSIARQPNQWQQLIFHKHSRIKNTWVSFRGTEMYSVKYSGKNSKCLIKKNVETHLCFWLTVLWTWTWEKRKTIISLLCLANVLLEKELPSWEINILFNIFGNSHAQFISRGSEFTWQIKFRKSFVKRLFHQLKKTNQNLFCTYVSWCKRKCNEW